MASRPTSASKNVEGLSQDQLALDRIATLREQFTQANDNQTRQKAQNERAAEGAQLAAPDRPASVAKSVEGLLQEQLALDRVARLRDQFIRARDNQQKENEQPGEGSPMIKQDRPQFNLTPSGMMRQVTDGRTSMGKFQDEHERANAKNEQARQALEEQKAREERAREAERDRER